MKELATYKRRAFLKDHPPVTAQALVGSTGAEATLLAGTVLGLKTTDGKFYPYTAAMTADATPAPVYAANCILAEDIIVPASGDKYATVYVHAAVVAPELVWDGSVSADQQKAAIKALRALGIYASEA